MPTPEKQAAEIKDALKEHNKMEEGTTWCYLNLKWFRLWIEYSQCDGFWDFKPKENEGAPPGPIDNNPLLHTLMGPVRSVEIRRDLQNLKDYYCLPEAVYDLLQAWHGGGPKIARKARTHNTGVVEPEVKVVKYPLTTAFLQCDAEGKPDFKNYTKREFAPADTFQTLKDAAKDILDEKKVSSAVDKLNLEEGKEEPSKTEAGEGENGEEAEGKDTTNTDFRIWIPIIEEEEVVEEKEGDDEKEVKWQLLAEAQLMMELGSMNLKPGALLVLVDKKVDGKWSRAEEGGGDWRASLKVDSKVDAKDTVHKWLIATVKEIKDGEVPGTKEVFIHYDNHATRWDEWIPTSSDRLAKANTKSKEERSSYYSSYSSSSYYSGSEGTPKHEGIVGLRNLGNTCFMNSTLQCMNQTPWLVDFLVKKNHLSMINRDNPMGHRGRIAEEFGLLVGKIWGNKHTVVAPTGFKQAIGEFAPQFSGYSQQDSQELLSFLVDGLHEGLNRLKEKKYDPNPLEDDGKVSDAVLAKKAWAKHKLRNDSVILDNMGGMFRSKITCPKCKTTQRKFDPFLLNIPVPLPSSDNKQQTVTVVYDDTSKKPLKIKVEVSKHGEISELKSAIGKVGGVEAKNLIIAEVFGNKIYKQYKPNDGVGGILDNDVIYAFECPKISEVKEWVSLPIQHFHESSYESVFGSPRVLIVDTSASETVGAAQVRNEIKRIVKPFVKENKPPEGSNVKDVPYTCFWKPSWGSDDPLDMFDEEKEAKFDAKERAIIKCMWGKLSEKDETYQKELVVDHSSVGGGGGSSSRSVSRPSHTRRSLRRGTSITAEFAKST